MQTLPEKYYGHTRLSGAENLILLYISSQDL